MNIQLLDFRNLSLKLLILFLSTAYSSGELWLVRATGLIKPTKKPQWIENERLCRVWVDMLGKGHSHTVWGCFHLHLWTFSSPVKDIQPLYLVMGQGRAAIFTAKVFRTSSCLAHLFASSLELQYGQGGIQLWN